MSYFLKSLTYALIMIGLMCSAAYAQSSVDNEELEFRRTGVPHWSEFPAMPTEVPTLSQIKSNVAASEVTRKKVEDQVSAIAWDEGSAEVYSSFTHGRMNKSLLGPYDSVMSVADIEAFAMQMRQKAKTPQPYDTY